MQHIEAAVQPGAPISEHLIRSLRSMAGEGLTREGDRTPGAYRAGAVAIAKSDHLPPLAIQVPGFMQELCAFVNRDDPPKYDLMEVALGHHRFAWIHPFGNGNGRVIRLVTYAMFVKDGFRVSADDGRLLNPAAVFCADRERYDSSRHWPARATTQGLKTGAPTFWQGCATNRAKSTGWPTTAL